MRASAVAALLAVSAACTSEGSRREDHVTQPSSPPRTDFDADAARVRLDAEIAKVPFLADADVARVPDLDAAGLLAFSAMPRSTGKAGEFLYWIGPDVTLSSGQAVRDFDRLMAMLGVGTAASTTDAHQLAHLFVRFRALRRGVVLDKADGHVLLQPGAIPADRFHAPRLARDAAGAHLSFWLYDTDRFEPGHWVVDVAPDGATRFTGP